MGIQEDQLKLNSKLALPNYLQLKAWWKHVLWLECDHYLSLQGRGGFVRFCLCHEKIYLIPPLGLCNVLPFPHWQYVGSQFFHRLPFILRWRRLILPPLSLKTMWSSPSPPPKKKPPPFPLAIKNDDPLTSWRPWSRY